MSQPRRQQQQQINDLRTLAEIGSEKLCRLKETLDKESLSPIRPGDLIAVFDRVLADEEKSDTIARVLVSMSGWTRQSQKAASDLLSHLPEAVGFSQEDIPQWDDSQKAIASLVESAGIRLVSKGIELAYEQTTLFRSAKVIADIRPIFDDDARRIDGGIVSFGLRIDYAVAGRDEAISLALDKQDIIALRDQLERALTKSETTKEWLQAQSKPVVVSGE